jgi:hypothetical protein
MNGVLRAFTLGAVAALGACSSIEPPLLFGDDTTFGLRLGNDTASTGGSASLGYKAQSVAVVPVSVLDAKGNVWLLKGHDGDGATGNKDSLSVFASFHNRMPSSSDKVPRTVTLNQVFATGLAAQVLTAGICRANSGDCPEPPKAASAPSSAEGPKASGAPPVTGPHQAPLLFLRTDVVGIDIGGAVEKQGLQFVLGYGNNNLAMIPVEQKGVDGDPVPVRGAAAGGQRDALSVVGQFDATSDTQKLNVGLERYFAVGVAARNLAMGIAAAAAASAASAPDTTTAANGAVASTTPPPHGSTPVANAAH